MTAADAESLAALWQDERVRRFLGGPIPEQDAQRRIRGYVAQPGVFAVVVAFVAQPVGLVVVDAHDSGDYELSYMFHPEAWGHGYARDTLRAVLDWSFTEAGLLRVIAVTQSANTRSVSLLTDVGMRPEREVVEHGARQTVLVAVP